MMGPHEEILRLAAKSGKRKETPYKLIKEFGFPPQSPDAINNTIKNGAEYANALESLLRPCPEDLKHSVPKEQFGFCRDFLIGYASAMGFKPITTDKSTRMITMQHENGTTIIIPFNENSILFNWSTSNVVDSFRKIAIASGTKGFVSEILDEKGFMNDKAFDYLRKADEMYDWTKSGAKILKAYGKGITATIVGK